MFKVFAKDVYCKITSNPGNNQFRFELDKPASNTAIQRYETTMNDSEIL